MEEEIDLTGMDAEFETATVEPKENFVIPDGKYQVRVEEARLGKVKKAGDYAGSPLFTLKLRVLGPEYANAVEWKNTILVNDPNKLKYLKNDLFTMGLKLAKISELPMHLKDLINVCLEMQVKTKDKYRNVYLNKRIDAPATSPAGDETAPF